MRSADSERNGASRAWRRDADDREPRGPVGTQRRRQKGLAGGAWRGGAGRRRGGSGRGCQDGAGRDVGVVAAEVKECMCAPGRVA